MLIDKSIGDKCERCLSVCDVIKNPRTVGGRPKYCCNCNDDKQKCYQCYTRK